MQIDDYVCVRDFFCYFQVSLVCKGFSVCVLSGGLVRPVDRCGMLLYFSRLTMVAIMVAMDAVEVPMVSHWARLRPSLLGLLATTISHPGRTLARWPVGIRR